MGQIDALKGYVEKGDTMKFVLSENFYIVYDPLNVILVEHHPTEKSESEVKRFYTKVDDALDRFAELNRKNKTEKFEGNYEEYIRLIKQANKELLDTLVMKFEEEKGNVENGNV